MRVSYGKYEADLGAGESVPNLLRAIALSPEFAALQWPLRKASAAGLDDRTSELVISAVAGQCRAGYVWGHHAPRLADMGISAQLIRGVRDGDLDSLEASDQALVRLARAVESLTVTDELWADACGFFAPETVTQVVFLASHYAMMCRIQSAFDVPLDPGSVDLQFPDISRDAPAAGGTSSATTPNRDESR
jgi:hypothetical protein